MQNRVFRGLYVHASMPLVTYNGPVMILTKHWLCDPVHSASNKFYIKIYIKKIIVRIKKDLCNFFSYMSTFGIN